MYDAEIPEKPELSALAMAMTPSSPSGLWLKFSLQLA